MIEFIPADTEYGDGYYWGMKLMYMGTLVKERNELVYLMDPYMEELAYHFQLCAHLAVLEGFRAKFIHKVVAGPFRSMRSHVGGTLPAYGTASGKCLLAYSSPREMDAYFKNIDLEPMTQETIVDEQELREELSLVIWACIVSRSRSLMSTDM